MKFPEGVAVYGDKSFRGDCPPESAEQITFFNEIRQKMPWLGVIATHVRNEGKRTNQQARRQIAEGMTKGAADIIIPGCPTFVCELKRLDHTKSRWEEGQKEYLQAAKREGAFVCVALGYKAALEAVEKWNTIRTTKNG